MANSAQRHGAKPKESHEGITRIEVSGYKSLVSTQAIDIRPLTILAGANSSGKSSIMQPVLLLKQTLEATYDPGALLIDGPNAKFTLASQLLARKSEGFRVSLSATEAGTVTLDFQHAERGFDLAAMSIRVKGGENVTFQEQMSHDQIVNQLPRRALDWLKGFGQDATWRVVRSRCFLDCAVTSEKDQSWFSVGLLPGDRFSSYIRHTIHLPGLRGNPEREYPETAVGSQFPGTFEKYTASVIEQWKRTGKDTLAGVCADLKRLNLTWKVKSSRIQDTRIMLEVGRLQRAAQGGASDLVNIADVGFGVSQALPVVVALRAAKPGQLVYIEQPEIHLHPRAQVAMASLLGDAAKRGVRVVAETHSSLLLLGVQSLVAHGKLPADIVKLHWFMRDDNGETQIKSAELDESGAFGEEWPEDFSATELEADNDYLDAAEARMWKGKDGHKEVKMPGD